MTNFTASIDITIKLPSKLNHALIKEIKIFTAVKPSSSIKLGSLSSGRGSNQSRSWEEEEEEEEKQQQQQIQHHELSSESNISIYAF
jgi:hypothetical protein